MPTGNSTDTIPAHPRKLPWQERYDDWVHRRNSGDKYLYEVSEKDRDWLKDSTIIGSWIELAGLTWHWKTPRASSDLESDITEIMTGEQLTYVGNLAYLSLQPHQEQERAEYILECLSGFFLWWPEAWQEGDDWRSYQDRVLTKAKSMKDLMEHEALDRARVVPPMPWSEWITLSPFYVDALAKKIRKADSERRLRWWRSDYDSEQSDSESDDEPDWEEEFLKLGEEERVAIQKEWEENEFRAEVLRNRRQRDIEADWDVGTWRRMGFQEDVIEERLCERLCLSNSDDSDGDSAAVAVSKSPAPSPELKRPDTPSANDSVWSRSDSPGAI